MAFDNHYPNRKDWRRPYHGSKAADRSCRSHGDCPWCEGARKRKDPMEIRVGTRMYDSEVDANTAEEMAAVGILPSRSLDPIGKVLTIAGQPFVVTGYATRAEFLDAVAKAGLPFEVFRHIPDDLHFIRVSTD